MNTPKKVLFSVMLLSICFCSNNLFSYPEDEYYYYGDDCCHPSDNYNPPPRNGKYTPEKPTIRLDDLVGSRTQEVKELIDQIRNPEKFEDLGIEPPNAVLLYGQPGTGKTTLARAIAGELDTYIFAVSGSDMKSKYFGGEAENLNEIFGSAREYVAYYGKPIIILFDELDGALSGLNSELNDVAAKEFLSKIKFEITNTEKNKGIYVFATTNYIDYFPKALTRSGRFMTIEVSLPNQEDRAIIFEKYMLQYNVEARLRSDSFYNELAETTAMFSGADIKEAVSKAALKAAYNNQKIVKAEDILKAIKDIHEKKHIELRRNKFAPEESDVHLEELAGGLTKQIQLLLKQLKYPKIFAQLGVSVPKAVLLHGPPGTGKTTLVRGIANYLDANLFSLSGSDIKSTYTGGATANLDLLFNNARKMAECSGKPSVILLDEMDGAISDSARREILAKLKYQLTENNENVFVFATTNHLQYFPAALTRPGRFVKIEVPLPSEKDRAAIFKKYANIYNTEKKAKSKKFCEEVARKTDGFSGADIAFVLEKAGQYAGQNGQNTIKKLDILNAIEEIKKNKD